jgi:hypothetical protein
MSLAKLDIKEKVRMLKIRGWREASAYVLILSDLLFSQFLIWLLYNQNRFSFSEQNCIMSNQSFKNF